MHTHTDRRTTRKYNASSAIYRMDGGRGVVVRECGGMPFRQIFWSRNSAPANIIGHRWNANTEAFQQITSYSLGWPSISLFSGPNCTQTRDLAQKSQQIFRGSTPSHTQPQHGYTLCAGTQAPPFLGPRSRKPFPQIKIYHYTPERRHISTAQYSITHTAAEVWIQSTDTDSKDDDVDCGVTVDDAKHCKRLIMSETTEQIETD